MRTAGLKYGDYPFKENVTTTFYYTLPYMVVGGSNLQISKQFYFRNQQGVRMAISSKMAVSLNREK